MLAMIVAIVSLVAVTVAIHAFGTIFWIRVLGRHYVGADGAFKDHKTLAAVTWSAVWLLMLHFVEVIVWAAFYLLITPIEEIATLEQAVYFSVVTFTTVGYGDITLADPEWRLLSGAEALNGVLLVGWSTALLFAVVQRCWREVAHTHAR